MLNSRDPHQTAGLYMMHNPRKGSLCKQQKLRETLLLGLGLGSMWGGVGVGVGSVCRGERLLC